MVSVSVLPGPWPFNAICGVAGGSAGAAWLKNTLGSARIVLPGAALAVRALGGGGARGGAVGGGERRGTGLGDVDVVGAGRCAADTGGGVAALRIGVRERVGLHVRVHGAVAGA